MMLALILHTFLTLLLLLTRYRFHQFVMTSACQKALAKDITFSERERHSFCNGRRQSSKFFSMVEAASPAKWATNVSCHAGTRTLRRRPHSDVEWCLPQHRYPALHDHQHSDGDPKNGFATHHHHHHHHHAGPRSRGVRTVTFVTAHAMVQLDTTTTTDVSLASRHHHHHHDPRTVAMLLGDLFERTRPMIRQVGPRRVRFMPNVPMTTVTVAFQTNSENRTVWSVSLRDRQGGTVIMIRSTLEPPLRNPSGSPSPSKLWRCLVPRSMTTASDGRDNNNNNHHNNQNKKKNDEGTTKLTNNFEEPGLLWKRGLSVCRTWTVDFEEQQQLPRRKKGGSQSELEHCVSLMDADDGTRAAVQAAPSVIDWNRYWSTDVSALQQSDRRGVVDTIPAVIADFSLCWPVTTATTTSHDSDDHHDDDDRTQTHRWVPIEHLKALDRKQNRTADTDMRMTLWLDHLTAPSLSSSTRRQLSLRHAFQGENCPTVQWWRDSHLELICEPKKDHDAPPSGHHTQKQQMETEWAQTTRLKRTKEVLAVLDAAQPLWTRARVIRFCLYGPYRSSTSSKNNINQQQQQQQQHGSKRTAVTVLLDVTSEAEMPLQLHRNQTWTVAASSNESFDAAHATTVTSLLPNMTSLVCRLHNFVGPVKRWMPLYETIRLECRMLLLSPPSRQVEEDGREWGVHEVDLQRLLLHFSLLQDLNHHHTIHNDDYDDHRGTLTMIALREPSPQRGEDDLVLSSLCDGDSPDSVSFVQDRPLHDEGGAAALMAQQWMEAEPGDEEATHGDDKEDEQEEVELLPMWTAVTSEARLCNGRTSLGGPSVAPPYVNCVLLPTSTRNDTTTARFDQGYPSPRSLECYGHSLPHLEDEAHGGPRLTSPSPSPSSPLSQEAHATTHHRAQLLSDYTSRWSDDDNDESQHHHWLQHPLRSSPVHRSKEGKWWQWTLPTTEMSRVDVLMLATILIVGLTCCRIVEHHYRPCDARRVPDVAVNGRADSEEESRERSPPPSPPPVPLTAPQMRRGSLPALSLPHPSWPGSSTPPLPTRRVTEIFTATTTATALRRTNHNNNNNNNTAKMTMETPSPWWKGPRPAATPTPSESPIAASDEQQHHQQQWVRRRGDSFLPPRPIVLSLEGGGEREQPPSQSSRDYGHDWESVSSRRASPFTDARRRVHPSQEQQVVVVEWTHSASSQRDGRAASQQRSPADRFATESPYKPTLARFGN